MVGYGAICYLSFQLEGFGSDTDRMKGLIGSGTWYNRVSLVYSFVVTNSFIVNSSGESISTSTKTIGHVTLHVISECGSRIVWFEHSGNVVAVGRRIIIYKIRDYLIKFNKHLLRFNFMA